MASDDRELLDDQIRYYRARAAEYDETSTPEDDPFAVDAARIREARSDVGSPKRSALEATHDHDDVFFGFFLSHVPLGRFEAFWHVLDGLLAPDGRVFFVDEAAHRLWDEDWIESGVVRRTLLDASSHHAVKVRWEPAELRNRLTAMGWDASAQQEGPFYWGTARR